MRMTFHCKVMPFYLHPAKCQQNKRASVLLWVQPNIPKRFTQFAGIGNESVLKTITNDTTDLFFKTAISLLLISNHNTFVVLCDKIDSVHFIWKIYLYFSTGNGQPREPALCQLSNFIHHRVIEKKTNKKQYTINTKHNYIDQLSLESLPRGRLIEYQLRLR